VPDSENFRRFVAGLTVAAGLLVLGLSGTCTLAFFKSEYGAWLFALIFGGPFIALGAFTLFAGAQWLRGRPTPFGRVLGFFYMLLGALCVIAGAAMLTGPSLLGVGVLSAALALLWLGWRMTKMP
jgi:hypothetical protein